MNQLITVPPSAKSAIIRRLAEDVPLDDYGMPQWIFRPDLIPLDILDEDFPHQEKHQHLNAAAIRLTYDEGFPTMPTGEPFWHQFAFEPPHAYQAFIKYVDMTEDPETPVRQLTTLATIISVPLEELQGYFHMFWWKARAKAHDLFLIASHQRLKTKRVMKMEMSHHSMAQEFVAKGYQWMMDAFRRNALGPEHEDYVEIKMADIIRMQDLMMKMQRVSLGLPAHGLSGNQADAPSLAASIEVTMRANAEGSEVVKTKSEEIDIRKLLTAPDDIMQAQEMIIKFSAAQEGGRKRGEGHFLDRVEFDDVDV